MAAGPCGADGARVVSHVGPDSRCGPGAAPILSHGTAGQTVRGLSLRNETVTQDLVVSIRSLFDNFVRVCVCVYMCVCVCVCVSILFGYSKNPHKITSGLRTLRLKFGQQVAYT